LGWDPKGAQQGQTMQQVDWDVVIVGAGPAGIGMALALKALAGRAEHPDLRCAVLESQRVGESFRRWPQQTRLITPSFAANAFGLVDLNAVDAESSPACHSGVEHLSGRQYAAYLDAMVQAHALPVVSGCKVLQVNPAPDGFKLLTEQGPVRCRFLIWATGEYQFPDLSPFEGAQHCLHTAQVISWTDFLAPNYCVIGGGESAADAAIHLVRQGRGVRLLMRHPLPRPGSESGSGQAAGPLPDPGLCLSPHTCAKLYAALDSGRLEIVTGAHVVRVSGTVRRGFRIHAADGRQWEAARPPILGTGFVGGGGARQIAGLWAWSDADEVPKDQAPKDKTAYPLLGQSDESTLTPGLFLVGPQVRQPVKQVAKPDATPATPPAVQMYCFIYKFRQRFAPIALIIAARMARLRQGSQNNAPAPSNECMDGSDTAGRVPARRAANRRPSCQASATAFSPSL